MENTPTILLVEDNEPDALFIRSALKKSKVPHSLQVVGDGERAIQYLAGDGNYSDRDAYPLPRLVLLDLGLPGKSGFDVLEWITHHAKPGIYSVVVLSGSNRPEDVVRAHELGARSFLTKPSSFDDLVEMVMSVTEYLDDYPLRFPSFRPNGKAAGP